MTGKKGFLISVSLLFASLLICQCGTDSGPATSTGPGGDGSPIDTLFADGFEEGLNLWVRDLSWTLASDAHTGNFCMKAIDNINILGSAEINADFDLSDYDSAALSFWSKTNCLYMLPETAEANVLIQVDDNYILETIWLQTFQVNQPWTEINIPLDQYCNGASQKLEISFLYYKSQTGGEIQWWIDDVMLIAENE